MDELKLSGNLRLDGTLELGGKVLINGSELLVQQTPTGVPHSIDGKPPLPNDPTSNQIWLTASANRGVKARGELVMTTEGLQYKQGAQPVKPGVVAASTQEIQLGEGTILAVTDIVTIGTVTMTLTNSGQKQI